MKVLLVSSKYPPEYSGSGLRAHRTHLRLANKYGIETTVICSSTEYLSSSTYEQDGLTVDRIVSTKTRKVHSALGKGIFRRLTNAAVFKNEMRRVTELLEEKSPDLIHAFGYSPSTMAAIKWATTNKIPLVRELVNAVSSPYQYPPGAVGESSYEFGERSVVVAISSELGDVSKRAGLIENVWVRPNPVDLERFRPPTRSEKSVARSTLTPFSDDDIVIVFVSKFRKSKNHTFLLDVLKQLPNEYKLILAGPPSDPRDRIPGLTLAQIEELTVKAAGMGIADRLVVHPGFVDTADYLRAADTFCMPAENEAMGTPLLEALASGLPVVANSGESSFREWIVDGRNGYLVPLDAQKWATAIQNLTSLEASVAESISRDISAQISTDSIDRQYWKLFQAVTASKPGETVNVSEVLTE